MLRDILGAKADDDHSVTVTFAPKRARDVPLFVAGLPIFSRAYYTTKKFDQSTLDPPLGSGAYKVGRFDAGRYHRIQRVTNWWGADLPVSRGQNNFDILRFEYYRDREVGFEGFTARIYLFREEFTSRTWKTRYDFPGVQRRPRQDRHHPGRHAVRRAGLVHQHAAQEIRRYAVREALDNAFDFEWTNKTIMYGCYERTVSVFQNSEMMANGKPSAGGAEAARAVPRPRR